MNPLLSPTPLHTKWHFITSLEYHYSSVSKTHQACCHLRIFVHAVSSTRSTLPILIFVLFLTFRISSNVISVKQSFLSFQPKWHVPYFIHHDLSCCFYVLLGVMLSEILFLLSTHYYWKPSITQMEVIWR